MEMMQHRIGVGGFQSGTFAWEFGDHGLPKERKTCTNKSKSSVDCQADKSIAFSEKDARVRDQSEGLL